MNPFVHRILLFRQNLKKKVKLCFLGISKGGDDAMNEMIGLLTAYMTGAAKTHP